MAKVFNAPKEIKVPNCSASKEVEEKFLKELKDNLIKRNPGKNVGEIIRFSVADGYAQYMIASMKPIELVHIATGDAYDTRLANYVTAKEIQAMLDFDKHWRTAKKIKDI